MYMNKSHPDSQQKTMYIHLVKKAKIDHKHKNGS